MSQENVEIVRRSIDALNRGDVEAALGLYDPGAEVVDPPDLPGATTHRGHEGIRRNLESFTRFWADWRMETDEVTAVGDDRAFAQGRAFGRGRASSVEVVRPFQLVASVRNGRLMQVRFYGTRREAREAVGLEE